MLIVFELARFAVYAAQTTVTYTSINPLFAQLEMPDGFDTSFKFIFAASFLTGAVYSLLKIGFYGFTIHYLTKPAVRDQFHGEANSLPGT